MLASIETDSPLADEVKCYPLTTIASAKAHYLVNGLSASEVSHKVGVDVATIHYWARVHGWTTARKSLYGSAISSDSVVGAVKAKLESIALQSADLADRTLSLAIDAVTEGRTRDVMFAASAIKTFADVASKHSGNDSASSSAQVNVTFSLSGLYRPDAVNVTPSIALPDTVSTKVLPAP